MGADTIDEVEYYSGYRGEETPRFVTISGIRHRVLEISGRKRISAEGAGGVFEEFRCLLDDDRTVSVKRPIPQ
jgi:hypothetical protein